MQTLVLDYHNKIYYDEQHCKVLVTQTGNTRYVTFQMFYFLLYDFHFQSRESLF